MLFTGLGCVCALGQTPAPVAEGVCHGYDVVSIRLNVSGSDKVSISPTEDSIAATNVSLSMLLAHAYRLREEQIFGLRGWALTARFDLVAKMSDTDEATLKSLTWPQRWGYLTKVLEERFHMATHADTKILPIYELMLTRGGTKLKQSPPAGLDADASASDISQTRGNMIVTTRFLKGVAVPMSTLATALSGLVGREVIDKTGSAGLYDISLQWVPLDAPPPPAGDPDISSALFTALQEELGLKLVASKGPVQTLVVDHIEMPTAN
jgi:uncharacterized protein (TIGR03435 family)